MVLNDVLLMVMRSLHNFFVFDNNRNHYFCEEGEFAVNDGNLNLNDGDFSAGDWIAITNARRNNGVFLLKDIPTLELPLVPYDTPHFRLSNGTDDINPLDGVKSLKGTICLIVFPVGFVALCKEIKAFVDNPENEPSTLQSESVIGLHSMTKATGKDGKPLGWQGVFSQRLLPWQKMFSSFEI
jgi:hypothetical protein